MSNLFLNAQQVDEYKNREIKSINSYKIGIYYQNEYLKSKAIKLKYFLEKSNVESNIELKQRDEDFFDKVGRNNGYEVRYEPQYESKITYNLKQILDDYDSTNVIFKLRPVRNRTEDFISIFIPN